VPKMRLWPGLRPGPCWWSLQRSPDPIAGFKRPTSKRRGDGRGGEKREGEGKGKEGDWRGKGEGKGKDHSGTSFSPLRDLGEMSMSEAY